MTAARISWVVPSPGAPTETFTLGEAVLDPVPFEATTVLSLAAGAGMKSLVLFGIFPNPTMSVSRSRSALKLLVFTDRAHARSAEQSAGHSSARAEGVADHPVLEWPKRHPLLPPTHGDQVS